MNVLDYASILWNHPIKNYIASIAAGRILSPAFTLIHECGHAAAMKMLFKNAKPEITFDNYGYSGGQTSWGILEPPRVSSLGKVFGRSTSHFIVDAVGPITETTTAVALLVLFNTPNMHAFTLPILGNIAWYALEGLKSNISGHDFQKMRKRNWIAYGIITAAICATAATVGVKAFSPLLCFPINGKKLSLCPSLGY